MPSVCYPNFAPDLKKFYNNIFIVHLVLLTTKMFKNLITYRYIHDVCHSYKTGVYSCKLYFK